MKKFWGFYENGSFRVGCNGGTVYIYDSDNHELATFKDFPYAYSAEFMLNKSIVAVKSTAGYIGFYDLDKLVLLKKVKFSQIEAQDEGFSFSADGNFFYNIEKTESSFYTELAIYEMESFTKIKTLFSDNKLMYLEYIEVDAESGTCYVSGYMRKPKDEVIDYGFVGIFDEASSKIINIRMLDKEDQEYLNAYKSWELSGFTEKSLEWNDTLKKLEKIIPVSIKEVHRNGGFHV